MSNDVDKQMTKSPLEQLTDGDADWQALSQDWQSQPYQKSDIKALIKQTRRRVLWSKSILALDLISTLALIVLFFVGLYQETLAIATLFYIGFGAIVSVAFCVYTFRFRFNVWRQVAQSPDNAIPNAMANCQASIRYLKVCKWFAYILFPVANWYIYEVAKVNETPLLRGIIFANALIIAVWGGCHYFQKKRHKEYIHLSSLNTK